MRFGLWVEPEMVNARSDLYEQHPDWVIHEPGRDRREERNQLVLDVLRPEVQAFVVDVIDRTLALHPGISYLKWDANRDVFESGSTTLPADRQSHLAVDRVRATNAIMAEVVRRHPDVELMLCASGGGRSNLETLEWFHELWTSDNTDPVDRVRIQWGASHLLPASVLGAHVTRWGDKPVAFGCAVALSARFGFDLDPATMTDDERTAAVQAAATAKRIRDLIQFGDLHRLVSPVGNDRAALAYLDPDLGSAVVFAYRLEGDDPIADPLVVPGLDTARSYAVEDVTPGSPDHGTTTSRTGADLSDAGLAWPDEPAPSARIWLVTPA
jgi:alpha-galactosidase